MTEVSVGELGSSELFVLVSIKNAALTNIHGGDNYIQVALKIDAAIELYSKLSNFLTDHGVAYHTADNKPIYVVCNPADSTH